MIQLILGANVLLSLVLLLVANQHTREIKALEENIDALCRALRQSLEVQKFMLTTLQRITVGEQEEEFDHEAEGKTLN